MVRQPEVLALIPARGGSKGIPHKNRRAFAGYPLIAYSIAAAKQAAQVQRVIVSTDDPDIAAIARECGAEVPFMRPEELAQDSTLDLPVFQHALDWLREHEGYQPDLVVQLRPTSPLRPVGLVDQAIQLMIDHPEADSVRGVVSAGQNPHKMWRIAADGSMKPLLSVEGISEPYNAPRQSLPPVYWQTGHIDVIRPEVIRRGSMSGSRILPVEIDPSFTVDIDTPRDWVRYEGLVRELMQTMVNPGRQRRPWPGKVSLAVFDFDGVMTDNRVWVQQDGTESVAANRSDGMAIQNLVASGFKAVIISTERNPVVGARASKLGLPYFSGVGDKASTLLAYLEQEGVSAEETIFVGNDINDLPCFPIVACAVAVADAWPEVLRAADWILNRKGGHGAVREVCDLIISQRGN